MSNSTISRGKLHSKTDKIEKFYSAKKLIGCPKKTRRSYPRKTRRNKFTLISSNNTKSGSMGGTKYYFAGHGYSPTTDNLHLHITKRQDYYSLSDVITYSSLSFSTFGQPILLNACRSAQALSESRIKEYFSLKPSARAQLRKKYAVYIKSQEEVFDILEFGNARSVIDAYDAAVDILAECDEDVLTHAIEIAREQYISDNNFEIAQSWEKNWEILIKALSCALKIESHRKMSLLLSLCDPRNKLSRLIKLTLIDAIIDLDIDKKLAMVMLQIFMSERELDNFVRNYASEQAEECL